MVGCHTKNGDTMLKLQIENGGIPNQKWRQAKWKMVAGHTDDDGIESKMAIRQIENRGIPKRNGSGKPSQLDQKHGSTPKQKWRCAESKAAARQIRIMNLK